MAINDLGVSNSWNKSKGIGDGMGLAGIQAGVSGISGGGVINSNNDIKMKNDQHFFLTNNIFTQKLMKQNGIIDTKNDNILRLNKPTDYNDAIIHNCNGLEKHVILCNIFPGIENFIATLRSKSLGTSRPPIVVLSN